MKNKTKKNFKSYTANKPQTKIKIVYVPPLQKTKKTEENNKKNR